MTGLLIGAKKNAVKSGVVILCKATCDLLTLVLLNKLMPHPFLIFSQSDYLIQIVDINSHT